jgi:Protein of unknown function (DUF3800)
MCAVSKPYSLMWHSLVSAFGSKWAERNLVMFTVYVDDSGTAPDQPVAVAAALIIPAKQLIFLESSWQGFKEKHGFADFHSSECAAKNEKSDFANWRDEHVAAAFYRARQIITQRASKAFSYTIHKSDFDAEAPSEWRQVGGQNHYTWALRSLINALVSWRGQRPIDTPFEFVFDQTGKREKVEIDMLMSQFESLWPGRFEGHYSFRNRPDVPGLQAADVLAWTCFAMSRLKFRDVPMPTVAQESFWHFSTYRGGEWLDALTHEREALRQVIALDRADTIGEQQRREWYAQWVKDRKQQGKAVPRVV